MKVDISNRRAHFYQVTLIHITCINFNYSKWFIPLYMKLSVIRIINLRKAYVLSCVKRLIVAQLQQTRACLVARRRLFIIYYILRISNAPCPRFNNCCCTKQKLLVSSLSYGWEICYEGLFPTLRRSLVKPYYLMRIGSVFQVEAK